MIAASRQWIRTFALWLSLAVVLTCAIGSFGSPVRASTGSAFNAFTSDVALGPNRATAPEKDRKEQTPPSGGASGQAKAVTATGTKLIPLPLAVARVFSEPAAPVPFVTAGPVGARAPPLS